MEITIMLLAVGIFGLIWLNHRTEKENIRLRKEQSKAYHQGYEDGLKKREQDLERLEQTNKHWMTKYQEVLIKYSEILSTIAEDN